MLHQHGPSDDVELCHRLLRDGCGVSGMQRCHRQSALVCEPPTADAAPAPPKSPAVATDPAAAVATPASQPAPTPLPALAADAPRPARATSRVPNHIHGGERHRICAQCVRFECRVPELQRFVQRVRDIWDRGVHHKHFGDGADI